MLAFGTTTHGSIRRGTDSSMCLTAIRPLREGPESCDLSRLDAVLDEVGLEYVRLLYLSCYQRTDGIHDSLEPVDQKSAFGS